MPKKQVKYASDPKTRTADITLARPEKLNAITLAMAEEIRNDIMRANADDSVNVIVLRGEGESLCSGGDASEVHAGFEAMSGGVDKKGIPTQRARAQVERLWWGRNGLYQTIFFSPKPVVVEAKGYCYGAGLYMCLYGWFVVASEDAKFASPAWRYFGPCGDLSLLIYTMGLKRAKEFAFRGGVLDARAAEKAGMVDKVVPRNQLEQEITQMNTLLATLPRDTRAAKKIQLEAGLDNIQVTASCGIAIVCDTLLSNMRIREGEFNFVKARRDQGLPGAFRAEERHFRTPLKVLK